MLSLKSIRYPWFGSISYSGKEEGVSSCGSVYRLWSWWLWGGRRSSCSWLNLNGGGSTYESVYDVFAGLVLFRDIVIDGNYSIIELVYVSSLHIRIFLNLNSHSGRLSTEPRLSALNHHLGRCRFEQLTNFVDRYKTSEYQSDDRMGEQTNESYEYDSG